MSTVSLKNIHKSYGNTEVIHGVDMDIEDGEFIVIVGPSGCGKSTLLRMVAGLETITKGDIFIDNRVVNDLEPMDRNIAMVFQNYALYPHMNVYDNMAYGLKIAKTPTAEIEERVNRAAKMLQLTEYLKRAPRELSGGQRQRVAMGRAIVRKPAVFLFDEPLSNLDAKLRVQMRLEIKDLQKELGITSLYVTHDQVEAMTLADRMIVMNDGIAEQIGAPLDVYNNPNTTFVGGFIGSPPMNFLNPDTFTANEAKNAKTMLEQIIQSQETMPATIGIRPEHMTICKEDKAVLKASYRYVEPLGAETLVHLVLASGEPITIRQNGSENLPDPGTICHLTFKQNSVCVFDAKGKRDS
ncbi:MAG: sn-glycerol-3-phosphate ABC transporter ATP-binding protein UgpC [Rhizobiaceae bacterium]|nr:sn-glycerol-3-phosphate ABC transporter ATP-binding protein UgpC [Rhizobiaceae bacterium]